RHPSLEELKCMSKAYKRTIATLLLQKPPFEKPLPKDCRTVNSSEIGKFHEKSILAVRKARALMISLLELQKELGVQNKSFDIRSTISNDPELIASQCQRLLSINEIKRIENPNHALEAYIERIESFGIAVFQISLTQDRLRGFSITDDLIPVIVIKKGGELATTKIFTLFHELGHIILNQGGLCDLSFDFGIPKIEKWCNSFAAEVLVPSNDFLNNPIVNDYKSRRESNWIKKDLIEIGKSFHVGPLVILRKLLKYNLTTREFYSEKHITWNRPSFGRNPHPEGRNISKETIKEKGRGYISLAFKAYDQNKIDLKDLSDFLGVSLTYIPKTRKLLNG
ncbi:MAG: ImmA/IrrE family metallo-endopeptidase, partial [Cyclobacteriaceae bacterium]